VKSLIVNSKIGKGTKVWHFANLYGCTIGKGCNIASYVEIGESVFIGDHCKIGAGAFIPQGVIIGNNVFVGPHTVFTNDRYPTSGDNWILLNTFVEDNVSIGANCSILAGVRIERGAIIGMGSIITRDVPAEAKVFGEHAKIIKKSGI